MTRGPLPQPTALTLLKGNPGKRALTVKNAVSPEVEMPEPPLHLSGAAREEWDRIAPILLDLRLITKIDMAALSLYCMAYGRLTEYENAFAGKVQQHIDAGASHSEAVALAAVAVTRLGEEKVSPLVTLIQDARREVGIYLAHFGLSPSTRTRVAPIPQKTKAPDSERPSFAKLVNK